MTLPIERARSRRPVTWLTVVGVLLLPAVIGGILVAALYNPTDRLDAMSTAIVNDDEAVTIDGQLVPLGRQLTAGLVEGSDEVASNLDWTITNRWDAADGLADGTYSAVVTIPENFSEAATSTAPGGSPEQATIEVTTAPDALIVDDAITAQVTQTAASLMGEELSEIYLENVFLGFTTLGDQLGQAADGADEWAAGARDAADGTVSLADGIRELATGADGLASGASELSSGVAQVSSGADQLASGTTGWAAGAGEWASGAREASDGLYQWASGARTTADASTQLADGLDQMADEVAQLPEVPQEIIDGANDFAANTGQIKQDAAAAAAELRRIADDCAAQGGSTDFCAALTDAADAAEAALPDVDDAIDQAGSIAGQVAGLAGFGPALTQALRDTADGAGQLSTGIDQLADGAQASAAGVDELADGADGLAAGASEISTGMSDLADGASQAAGGAAQWAGGAGAWASGAGEAADGADELADGVDQLAGGADTLATGLHQASDELPSYTDDEATELASVVTDPVGATGAGANLFGASAIPLLASLALWFGGLATFVALQAVSRSALTSRRPSAVLALRSFLPAAAIGAVQGLTVAGVVQLAASYAWSDWSAFAVVCVVAGVAFAAVNQALVALLGGAGRWVSALVGALALATGVVSTVPGVLSQLAQLMPTMPAYNAMLAALGPVTGVAAGLAGLLIWALLALGVTTLAVTRRRTVSIRAVAEGQAATA